MGRAAAVRLRRRSAGVHDRGMGVGAQSTAQPPARIVAQAANYDPPTWDAKEQELREAEAMHDEQVPPACVGAQGKQ